MDKIEEKRLMKEQQTCNLEIVYEILDYILENPEMRFVQSLWAMGIADGKDLFYEPSQRTLEKIKFRKDLNDELKRRANAREHETSKEVEEKVEKELSRGME